MKFGIDRLLAEPELRAALKGRRVALLGHPASVTLTSSTPWTRSLPAATSRSAPPLARSTA